jgi:signal transduction histidine kinase
MNGLVRSKSEELVVDLVHELRQPLSTLEYSSCYLQMLLGEAQEAVQEQLRIIQQQIDLATRMLSEAAARIPRPEFQRAATGESLDLTKSETAAVT